VWAPFADAITVVGDFNDWSETATPLERQDNGDWYGEVTGAQIGQEYKYAITYQGQKFQRNDPRALQLTSSGDSSIIVDSTFPWQGDNFSLPSIEHVVLYELHVGTFARNDPALPGTFHQVATKLDYLADLGVTAIEVMPCNSVWMDRWWGYTPSNIYAVEAAYGGRRAFMEFVRAAHAHGIGVILDVVYNHLSQDPGLDLWQFDGWHQGEYGGIYFYNDDRAETPWGKSRPDWGRPEVRSYIADNVAMWLDDCHVDGLRVDSTLYIRNTAGRNNDPEHDLSDGWKLLQEITDRARAAKPTALLIAEDLQGNDWITKPTAEGGAGFSAQWDLSLGLLLRDVLDQPLDESRDLEKLRIGLNAHTGENAFTRVIYGESHDADANGRVRLNEEIAPGDGDGLFARKRAALAAAILLTVPGVPMLFQGQEFQEVGAFSHWAALDWHRAETHAGIVALYQHLIALRLNRYDNTAGLLGQHIDVFHVDNQAKVLGYHRWDKAGKSDDVVVIANFANKQQRGYQIAFPTAGIWWTRLNSDWRGYSADFGDMTLHSVEVAPAADNPQKLVGSIDIAPYSVLILSQDR
jgi:1,4-alpha-glucan branching enzyme